MEIINGVWSWLAPLLGTVTVSGVIGFVVTLITKAIMKRFIAKINVEKVATEATNKGIEKIKQIDFKHNIEPIAKSELKKVSEEANARIEEQMGIMKKQYQMMLNVFVKFSAYFEDSMISDQKKAELHEALSEALGAPVEPAIEEVGTITIEETKHAKESQKTTPQAIQGDR